MAKATEWERKIREDAAAIWKYAVDAVDGRRVVRDQLEWDGRWLVCGEKEWDLSKCERLLVVGGGKAVHAMQLGVLDVFQQSGKPYPNISGWLNIPQGVRYDRLSTPIHLCEARPAARNEPTEAGVLGCRRMLELVGQCKPTDFVITLLSGGGSALMPLPVDGITLGDKLLVTQWLSRSGANIEQLNGVRRSLSQIKAGGLARNCRSDEMLTLVLSDVLGDSLQTIASGPTLVEVPPDSLQALKVVDELLSGPFAVEHAECFARVRSVLRRRVQEKSTGSRVCRVHHHIVANNASAVDAAGQEAVRLGYAYWMQSANRSEGDVEQVAQGIISHLQRLQDHIPPDCILLGGEPVVRLPSESECGSGGRNQQLVLSVLLQLSKSGRSDLLRDAVFLSGGTDGEDGPTDAAGAWIDESMVRIASADVSTLTQHWSRCDAYPYLDRLGCLIKTGATDTNVCDLRVLLRRTP